MATIINDKWSIRLGTDGYEINYFDTAATLPSGREAVEPVIFDGLAAADLVKLLRALQALAIVDPLLSEQLGHRFRDAVENA